MSEGRLMKRFLLKTLVLSISCFTSKVTASEPKILPLQIISYGLLMQQDPSSLETLRYALYHDGIVGIRGIPGYEEAMEHFISQARSFAALPEEIKNQCAPNRERGDLFLGYEKGKEKFKRPDGNWVIDDLKASYYAFIPDCPENYWPKETELKEGFCALGSLMAQMGESVMEKIGLIGPSTGIDIEGVPQVGRMLYYQHSLDTGYDNPYWCGAHFDHGFFTVLTPAVYFAGDNRIDEPEEAGLFVKVQGVFQKVPSDPSVMLFQAAEFGQLALDDEILATEHRVHKALGPVERYAMALFFEPSLQTTIHSHSRLTEDSRYGGSAGSPCSYLHWTEESFKRYIVEEEGKTP